MKNFAVVKTYAKALSQILASNPEVSALILSSLKELNDIFGEESIKNFFEAPFVSKEDKIKALEISLQEASLDKHTVQFLKILIEKERLSSLSEIIIEVEKSMDFNHGILKGVVTSASPLSDEQKQRLEESIGHFLKNKVLFDYREDPQVVGGLVAHVGGWTFNDSIEMHTKKLIEDLNRGAH